MSVPAEPQEALAVRVVRQWRQQRGRAAEPPAPASPQKQPPQEQPRRQPVQVVVQAPQADRGRAARRDGAPAEAEGGGAEGEDFRICYCNALVNSIANYYSIVSYGTDMLLNYRLQCQVLDTIFSVFI